MTDTGNKRKPAGRERTCTVEIEGGVVRYIHGPDGTLTIIATRTDSRLSEPLVYPAQCPNHASKRT